MKLRALLVADPHLQTAEFLAQQCERLADVRIIATGATEALQLVRDKQPETAIISLELSGTTAKKLVPQLREAAANMLILATYRELSVPEMGRLHDCGVDEFIAQPVDILQVYRAASRRFKTPFRRHDRFRVIADVLRADGVMIGRTCDISEGGMCMEAFHPVNANESILVDLQLGDVAKPLRVRCLILGVDGAPPKIVRARVLFDKLWGPEQRRLVSFLQAQGAELITAADRQVD